MSFVDYSTYGPVSIQILRNRIYLNHPVKLIKHPENEGKERGLFLHCMALTREEAKGLIDSLKECIEVMNYRDL